MTRRKGGRLNGGLFCCAAPALRQQEPQARESERNRAWGPEPARGNAIPDALTHHEPITRRSATPSRSGIDVSSTSARPVGRRKPLGARWRALPRGGVSKSGDLGLSEPGGWGLSGDRGAAGPRLIGHTVGPVRLEEGDARHRTA